MVPATFCTLVDKRRHALTRPFHEDIAVHGMGRVGDGEGDIIREIDIIGLLNRPALLRRPPHSTVLDPARPAHQATARLCPLPDAQKPFQPPLKQPLCGRCVCTLLKTTLKLTRAEAVR